MAGTGIVNALADWLRSQSDVVELLPGGIWTRRIKRNDNGPGQQPTPGSTPGAFDHAGRILRCVSILPGALDRDEGGPPFAFAGYPEIYVRCLPVEIEEQRLDEAVRLIMSRLHRAVITDGHDVYALSAMGLMGLDDDPVLAPSMVELIRVQTDTVRS